LGGRHTPEDRPKFSKRQRAETESNQSPGAALGAGVPRNDDSVCTLIADLKSHRAPGWDGGALSIFYCEEAFGFLESCSMDDEKYRSALIRMYGRFIELVSRLFLAGRTSYIERHARRESTH
jgi:hypothetical protein